MCRHWQAPEIMAGEHASPASDVYSFGVVLWELLTWEVPWHKTNPWQVRRIEQESSQNQGQGQHVHYLPTFQLPICLSAAFSAEILIAPLSCRL